MIKTIISDAYQVARKSYHRFLEKDPVTLAGSLAFFTVFAIPPILIIIINSIGLLASNEFASEELFNQIHSLWGEKAVELIQNIVRNYSFEEQPVLRQIMGAVVFLFASSSLFVVMQHSLNQIWGVKPKPKNSILNSLKNRALSFGIILLLTVMLLVSVLLDSFLLLIQQQFSRFLPDVTPFLFGVAGYLLSFLLVAVIIVIIYKYLASVTIEWKVACMGAFITSFLFSIGKLVIGFVLTKSNLQELYGIVGSLIGILLWVFYSAIILFYGAEVTQQYARAFSKPIRPAENAVRVIRKEVRREENS